MFTIEFLIDYCQENSNSQILNVARIESVDRNEMNILVQNVTK